MNYKDYYKAGGLWPEELERLHKYIIENSISNIVEIGAGYSSTRFFKSLNLEVTSYETNVKYMEALKKALPNSNFKVNFKLWDGNTLEIAEEPQVIFIDGPKGAANREVSIIAAKDKKCNLIIHDYSSNIIQEFCKKHLVNYTLQEYFFMKKNGGVCNLAFYQYEK